LNDAVEKTRNGAIVYDTDLINQISDGVLRSAGRGDTMIVGNGEREFVLRHYVRGGLPGRLVRDKYLWTGEAQSAPSPSGVCWRSS